MAVKRKGMGGGTHRKSDFRWGREEVKESPIENETFKARLRESVNILQINGTGRAVERFGQRGEHVWRRA